jgi:asparagine synthase (glutamine-hydrolysing)
MEGSVNHNGNVSFVQSTTLDGRVFIASDARIDNRQELIRKLQALSTTTDEELILLAYEAWDEACVNHLLGDFSFAIWDAGRKQLFCARDHFGVKPFFYARARDSFIFSNNLDVLRQDASVSGTLNETAIADYLIFGLNQDPSSTTFRDIQRLPAAHTLNFANNSLTTRRYWTLELPSPIRFSDQESYVERFTELLTTAVADRLRTDRVAISMSGGLDSTSLAAIASELLDHRVQGVSNVYDDLIPDEERHYSNLAGKQIGIPISYVNADQFTLFEQRELLRQPEPFLISPLSGQFNELMRRSAAYGRVMLTGYDGDAFMHEPTKRSVARDGHGGPRQNPSVRSVGMALRGHPTVDFFYTAFKRIFRHKPLSRSFYPEWIDESFAQRNNLRERSRTSSAATDKQRPAAFAFFNSKVWTPLFEGYHHSSTRLDLDVRHPFMDLRIVEYLLAIPVAPWCVNKHILRVAMKDRLPAAVLDRQKTPLAGDPALQLVRRSGVRWLDSFEVNPQLERFVNLKLRRPVADEDTSNGLWASLRVFALNYWLSNSQPVDRRATENQLNENRMYQTSIA